MLGLIGILFPFLRSFLGEGVINSYIHAQTERMNSASEVDKVWIKAQVDAASFELKRRQAQRDLQIAEMPYASMRWPKSMIMWAVALYWFGRFMIEALGLGDYGVVIHELSPTMDVVSKTVLAYMFLDGSIQRIMRK